MISKMAEFEDEASCRAYHLDLGKETFQLKSKDLMGYVMEQVKLWAEKRQLIQQREDKITEANLARENAERELAREATQAALTGKIPRRK